MEIPKIWRLGPVMKGFKAELVDGKINRQSVLRYPGGEVPVTGDLENIYECLRAKGFKEEIIIEMLFTFFGAVTTETPVTRDEAAQSLLELFRGKVGKEDRSEVKFGVG